MSPAEQIVLLAWQGLYYAERGWRRVTGWVRGVR